MCGIAGIHNAEVAAIDQMVNALQHRGPDARGTFVDNAAQLALGQVRLAIIDLDERSNQPFESACGRYCLVFNGEIYNYRQLKAELSEAGQTFRTESDTEVLLYWLVRFGTHRLQDLDGMFAFCLYDKQQQEWLLARDHIGEKPLYYSAQEQQFAFASEIPALLQLSWVDRRVNLEALKNFLFFLYTPAPRTLFNGIQELAPGQWLRRTLHDSQLEYGTFFSLTDSIDQTPERNKPATDIALFKESFNESIRSRLTADVPVGMYLSGGLDSNAIVAAARTLENTDFQSFTMSYELDPEAAEYDESDVALRCAEHLGISAKKIQLDPASSIQGELERTVNAFGQPFGNATSLAAESLAEAVVADRKVCLVGDGGDELLVGYPRYKAIPWFFRMKRVPRIVRKLLLKAVNLVPERGAHATPKRRARQFLEALERPLPDAYLHWVGYSDFHTINNAIDSMGTTPFYNDMFNVFSRYAADPIRAAEIVDFLSFVPYNLLQAADRTSMRHSLELRSPFVAKDLVLTMLRLSSTNKLGKSVNKPILVEALKDVLPPFILNIPKRPFNPPMRQMIHDNMDFLHRYMNTPGESKILEVVSSDFITAQLSAFENDERDNSTYLWGLAGLECWLRRYYPEPVEMVRSA